jgi:predicted kinase
MRLADPSLERSKSFSVRFSESEWDRIELAARVLVQVPSALIRDGSNALADAVLDAEERRRHAAEVAE